MFDLGYDSHQYRSKRPGYMGTSLQQFFARFPDDEACFRHVFTTRFGDHWPCPKCEKPGLWYRINGCQRMQHPCGYGFHPLANTIFQHSTIPLQLWFYALLHFANSAEGVDTPFISRHLGLSHKASFSLARRIRLHLASLEGRRRIGGEGKCVSVWAARLRGIRQSGRNQFPAKLVLLYDGHSVTGMVVTQARRHVLNAVLKMCTIPGSRYITSCADTYRIGTEFGSRSPIMNYSLEFGESNRGGISGEYAFYEYLCRPLRDHHRRIDQGNLWLYFAESLFRFNRRLHSDQIFSDMVSEFMTLDLEAKMAVQERFYHLSNGEMTLL